jgi:hypothetical protein
LAGQVHRRFVEVLASSVEEVQTIEQVRALLSLSLSLSL